MSRTSYEAFLRETLRMHPDVLDLYRRFWIEYFALGLDSIPATWIADAPLVPGLAGTVPLGPRPDADYIYHFPDGNASIARLLVRGLIPAALPGDTMQDVVGARLDYARIDDADSPVRLRLNSTAVRVATRDDGDVLVAYVRGGRTHAARARHCVLACYNRVVPHIFPELPPAQRRALAHAVKAPLVYVNVLLRSWRAFVARGVHEIMAPGSFFTLVALDFPVSLGSYRHPRSPDEPIVVHMAHVPHHPDEQGAAQWQAGRRAILATPFARFEERVRDQLGRMLGPGGFDADRDLLAITVNRWPHGYAYTPNSLWDPAWRSEAETPWVVGRRRRGNVAIANSDAGAAAVTEAAIDQAHRAVGELLRRDG